MAIYVTKLKHLTLLQRLEIKTVKQDNGCWEWIGSRDTWGHGRTKIFGVMGYIHRFAWEHFFGPIPVGMFICHKCDNPPCWNPDHLFMGTNLDNFDDMRSKDRHAKGIGSGRAKLTDDLVREIRAKYDAGGITTRELAKDYPVNHATIWLVTSRRGWKHVA